MTVNTATWLNHRKQFFKGFKIVFPYCFLYYFRAALIKADIQFRRNNMLRNEDEEFWTLKYSTMPLNIRWNHTLVNPTFKITWNNVLLFLLQIWKTGILMFLWLCFLPLILLAKSVVKFQALEAAIRLTEILNLLDVSIKSLYLE